MVSVQLPARAKPENRPRESERGKERAGGGGGAAELLSCAAWCDVAAAVDAVVVAAIGRHVHPRHAVFVARAEPPS